MSVTEWLEHAMAALASQNPMPICIILEGLREASSFLLSAVDGDYSLFLI